MVDLGARARGEITRIAVVMDVRSRAFTTDLTAVIKDLDGKRLPAAADLPRGLRRGRWCVASSRCAAAIRCRASGRLVDGIAAERDLLRPLREAADLVVDTSTTSVPTLRATLERTFGADYPHHTRVTLVSFGYKFGLPMDSDLVVDVRFLPNPFWIPELRDQTGRDEPVRDYVLSQDGAAEFIDRYLELLGLVGGGLPPRGQALPDRLRRLHGRQAPQRRDQRGDRPAARGQPRHDGQRRPPGPGARMTVIVPAQGRARPGRLKATALGGGHGLHATLSALRLLTDDVTAVVTVADDGGSSGRLRRELGLLPPGDLRMALVGAVGRRRVGQAAGARSSSTASAAAARWRATPSATCSSRA